jgi:hypothetical protein
MWAVFTGDRNMGKTKFILICVFAVFALTVAQACQKEPGPAEKAGKQIDKAVEKAGDKIDEAADKLKK